MKFFLMFLVIIGSCFITKTVLSQSNAPLTSAFIAQYYEGGPDAMNAFIKKNINYPSLLKRMKIEGECIVLFTIEVDGTLSNISIDKNHNSNQLLTIEALRVVKLLKFKAPNNKIQGSIPIYFKL